jgi:hypothetical protein
VWTRVAPVALAAGLLLALLYAALLAPGAPLVAPGPRRVSGLAGRMTGLRPAAPPPGDG